MNSAKQPLRYRLALDLGTNSIGWCIYRLDDANQLQALVRTGVRIFGEGRDPKSLASLAADRRLARSMRRRRDRFLARQEKLVDRLIRNGLLPMDSDERRAVFMLDPYVLRQRALDEKVSLAQLGRALFHLNRRRGFKSNRKVDKANAESGKISDAIRRTREALAAANARTYGEWLATRHMMREGVRARLRGTGAKASYEIYPSRDLLHDEFLALWAAQAVHHPELTDALRDEIDAAIFRQRPLKPVRPGKCTFFPEEERAPLALPSAQRARILQDLNHLRLSGPSLESVPLTLSQRNLLARLLEEKASLSFDTLRTKLKLARGVKLNLEDGKRDRLHGNTTTIELAKPERFGARWSEFSDAQQDDIVERLLAEESEEALLHWLEAEFGLDAERARAVAGVSLRDGYGRLSRKALDLLLPALRSGVITYDEAVQKGIGVSHSQFHTGELLPMLPYYGEVLERHTSFGSGDINDNAERRYGKIANPTVHIVLNQVRVLVNAMIERWGHPSEIIVETARELPLGAEGRQKLQKEQSDAQKKNDEVRAKLVELGVRVSGENLIRYKLWEELDPNNVLDRRCPYTGEQISTALLFTDAVEIDHILPFSRTLDDSLANRVLCMRRANRAKSNSTPWEAFGPQGHSREDYDWNAIVERATRLGRNRYKLFAADAIEQRLKGEDFLARQLNDTRYISRIVREYLGHICNPYRISVTPGRLTALLRAKWGLNDVLSDKGVKNRDDHRHHAVDAIVIGATDRRTLQSLSTAAARSGELGLNRLIDDLPEPLTNFRDRVQASVSRLVVSYKPDHGANGALHNETAYGIVSGPDAKGVYEVTHRVPLDSIQKPADIDALEDRDPGLAKQLRQATEGRSGKDFIEAVARFGAARGLRRVRVTERMSVIPIADPRDPTRTLKAYKGDSNYCIEIVRDEGGRWVPEVISTFAAMQIERVDPKRLRHPTLAQSGKALVMRLCINDLVAVEIDGSARKIMRVAGISVKGPVTLAEHFEANTDKRNRANTGRESMGFKYWYPSPAGLFKAKARRIFVDPLGFVLDPGFRP